MGAGGGDGGGSGGAAAGTTPAAANEVPGKKRFSPQVEAAANSYFQNVYQETVTIPGLVQQMQLFKA
eukprot:SAG22_NODE_4676_length_1196_cov_0.939836_2_plen_66_part_01